MIEGGDGPFAYLPQESSEGLSLCGEVPEGQGVDEHADDRKQVGVNASRRRSPHHDVVLAAQAG